MYLRKEKGEEEAWPTPARRNPVVRDSAILFASQVDKGSSVTSLQLPLRVREQALIKFRRGRKGAPCSSTVS